MQKIELRQAIGIFANVGVIVSIAFLALELQQNNNLMEAEARAPIVFVNSAMWQPPPERIGVLNTTFCAGGKSA